MQSSKSEGLKSIPGTYTDRQTDRDIHTPIHIYTYTYTYMYSHIYVPTNTSIHIQIQDLRANLRGLSVIFIKFNQLPFEMHITGYLTQYIEKDEGGCPVVLLPKAKLL